MTKTKNLARLGLERLEGRDVPATRVFTGINSALWSDPGNWTLNTPPAPGDKVYVGALTTRGDIVVDGAYGIDGWEFAKSPFTVRVQQPFASSGLVFGDGDVTWVMDRDVTFTGTVSFKGSDKYEAGPNATGPVKVRTTGEFYADTTRFWGVDLENAGTLTFGYAGEAAATGTLTVDASYGPSADIVNTGTVRVGPSGSGSIVSAVTATSYLDVAGGQVVVDDSPVAAYLLIEGPVTSLDSASSVTVGKGGMVTYLSDSPAAFGGASLTIKKGGGWYGDLTLVGGVVDAVSDGVTTVVIGGDMTASGTRFTTSGPNPNRVTVTSGAAPAGVDNIWTFASCTFDVNVYTSGSGDSSVSTWHADRVNLSGSTTVNLTRVSGAGTPPAGTWFVWLDGDAYSGTDPATWNYTGTLSHRLRAALGHGYWELNFDEGGGDEESGDAD